MDSIIRLSPRCIACLLSKHMHAWPEGTPQQTQIEYMQRLLRLIADAPASWGAPVLVSRIKKLRGEMFGYREDFEAVKVHFNRLMLTREEEISRRILAAPDPLMCAVEYAMIGNYIDFGALSNVEEDALDDLLSRPEDFAPDAAEYAALREGLEGARHLAYLTDNCGEIVLDKLFIRTLLRLYPQLQITIIVRGAPVLNDATPEDAKAVGLNDIVPVIGNGSDVAGTHLEELSPQAREFIDRADLIIAKGQANHATMRHCGKNVFYLFLCKCDLFAERFGLPKFSGVLIHDSRC